MTCHVRYSSPRAKATRALWKLKRGKDTIAHGTAHARHGEVTLDLRRVVRRGRYTLSVVLAARGHRSITVSQSVRIR